MEKGKRRIALLLFICFVVVKMLLFGQELCEKANEISNKRCNQLEMICNEG